MIRLLPGKIPPPVIISSLVLAFSLFGDSLLYAVLPVFAEDLGIPLILVGLLLSINRWIRLFSNSLAVATYRRIGFYQTLFAACTVTICTVFIYAYPAFICLFIAARILWGICWSHLRLGTYLVVIKTARDKLGLAMGGMHAVSRLGSAFTLLTGGILVDRLGYSGGLTIMAFFSSLAIPMVFMLRGSLRNQDLAVSEQAEAAAGNEINHRCKKQRLKIRTDSSRLVYLYYSGGFVTSLVNRGLVVSSIALLLQKRMTAEVQIFGLAIGVAALAGALLASRWFSTFLIGPIAGYCSDQWGRRPFLLLAFAVQTTALALIGLTAMPLWTVAGAVPMFIAGNAVETVIHASVAGTAAKAGNTAVIMSRYATFDDLGSASGPLLGYLLATMIGFTLTYLAAAAISLTVLCWYLIRLPRN